MAELAKLALFAEIQKTFNLHPGMIAEYIVKTAKHERQHPATMADQLAEDLIPSAQEVFAHRLLETQTLLSKTGATVEPMSEVLLTKCFNLDPEKIAKLVLMKVEQVGIDPMEVVDRRWTQAELVVMSLRQATRDMIPWACSEAARIVKEQEVA